MCERVCVCVMQCVCVCVCVCVRMCMCNGRMHIGRREEDESMIVTLRLLCVCKRVAEIESSIYGWRKLRGQFMFRAGGIEQRHLKVHHDSRVTYIPPRVPMTYKDHCTRTGKAKPLRPDRESTTTVMGPLEKETMYNNTPD